MEKEEEKEKPFENYKCLDEIKQTKEYKEAKERILLIQDIYSINEENFEKVIDELKNYLIQNKEMVRMFILVSCLFLITRYKSANKFGSSLLKFFKDNYLNEIKELINIKQFNHPGYGFLLDDVNLKELLTNDSKDLFFYNYEEGTIPYFLLNDDLSGLQDYVSKQLSVNFNDRPTNEWIPTEFTYFKNLNIFEYSIVFGSVKCFKFIMLQDNIEISTRSTDFAVSSGNTEIIHILENKNLKFGVDCFVYSILFHQNNIFEWLILNHSNHILSLKTFIDLSIQCFDEEILYLLLHNGLTITSPIQSIYFCEVTYPIHIALYSFNFPLFKYIYETYYPTLNPLNGFDNNNLFRLVCMLKQMNVFQYFITKGKIDIEYSNYFGYRPIHYACEHGMLPIVKYLISKGCDTNPKTLKKETPFYFACINNHFSVAEYLLNNTKIDINCKDYHGKTLLEIAYFRHNLELVKFLVEHGCDINIEDESGNLFFYSYYDENIIKYIASVTKEELVVDRKGITFLHFSAFHNFVELLKYLISINLDKDIRDKEGKTPLHYAYLNNSTDVIKYLISIHANQDIKDIYGKSPIDYSYLTKS